jgi:two-component system sensor histidine kinase BaeS
VTLVDAAGQFVAGDPLTAAASARRPVLAQGKPVGALLFVPGRLPGEIEAAFLSENARDLAGAGAMALALSAVWAVLLARYILAPIRRVAAGARHLAEGTLSTRIDTGRRDELGDLVRDFNTLAATLEAAEQARRHWVADTSHELRTPLAVLRAQIEALQDGVHDASPQSLGRLHEEVLRMTRLVDDLHELARADSHALNLRLEPVDPGAILTDVVARFAARRQAAGLGLDTAALGASGATVLADPDRLRQVFANLLENAIRYTDQGGMIRVSNSRMPTAIRLTVEDSAPAVPDTKLPRLFDRFFRVDSSRSRQTGGSGLGLAICKAIIEAHGGTISAAPSPLGGLAVTVALPVAGPRP